MPIYKDPSDNTSSPEVRYGGRTGHAGHAEQLDPQLTYDTNNLEVPSYQLHDLPQVSGPLVRTGGPIGAYAHVEVGLQTILATAIRHFTALIAGAAQYYSIPPLLCTGDCKVTALVYFTGDEIVIIGNTDSEGGLLVLATGALQWRPVAGGGEYHSHAGDVPLNRLSIITADRTGDDGHMTVNTLTVFDHKVATNDFTINAIGATGGQNANQASYSTGIVANVLLEGGGVPLRSYAIAQNMATSGRIIDSLAPAQPELYTFNGIAGWAPTRAASLVTADGDIITCTSIDASTCGASYEMVGLTIGDRVYVRINLERTGTTFNTLIRFRVAHDRALGASDVTLKEFAMAAVPNFGTFDTFFEVTATTMYIGSVTTAQNAGEFHSIEILTLQVDSTSGTAVNITKSAGEFTTDEVLDWLGPDLITQAIWETPSDAQSVWSFTNDQWSIAGNNTGKQLLLVEVGAQPPAMRLLGNIAAISGDLRVVSSGGIASVNSIGPYARDIYKGIHGPQLYKRDSGIVNATLDKPSLQQLLELGAPHPLLEAYFTRLIAGASQHYEIPSVTLNVGDSVALLLFHSPSGTGQYVLDEGGDSASRLYLYVNSTTGMLEAPGGLSISIDGGGNTDLRDGKLHEAVMTVTAGSYTFDMIGIRYSLTESFNGIIANVRALVAGTLIRHYKLDKDMSQQSYIENSAVPLGAELWGNAPYVTDGSESNYQVLESVGGLTAGVTYLYEFSVAGLTVGSVNLVIGTMSIALTSNGARSAVITSASTQLVIQAGATAPNAGATVSVSIKQADGWGTAENINASLGHYVEQGTHNWLGDDEVWGLGDYTFDGTETNNTVLLSDNSLTVGDTYRWNWAQTIVDPTATKLLLGGVEVSAEDADGHFTGIATVATDEQALVSGPQSSNGTFVSGISVRHLIEVP